MKIGLIGNQNSGKSSLFNLITNSNQMVGNWAGVTVDKEEKKVSNNKIIDLPGIYSLNAFTEEEKITVNYINKLDIIINVIDATNLERSLYLTLQLIDLKKPMVIVLTMKDLIIKKHIKLDVDKFEKLIDLPIILISSNDTNVLNELKSVIKKSKISKLSFKDDDVEKSSLKKYQYIDKVCNSVLKKNKEYDLIDKIILNRYLAIPIFLIIMFLIYYLSFNSISIYISNLINYLIQKLSLWISNLNVSKILTSLITDGILNSIGTILSFIPSLAFLFLFMSFLEFSGYMSRIAFIMDKLFRKIGLSGKSIIPFIIGTSCSVPAVLATRPIDNEDERYITMMLTSLIPCSAKMTIIMLFIKIIFPENTGIHIFNVYLLSIFIIIIISIILKKYIFKNTTNYFLNEIPDYKLPNLKTVFKVVYSKLFDFIKRITKTVIISSIIIWLLYSFDFSLSLTNVDSSILGIISKKLSFIFYPILGKNSYESTIAIIQGFLAKEQVVSSLLISSKLQNLYIKDLFNSNIAMYSFMIFNLFCFPCINTIITLKKEIGLKLTLFNVLFQTIVAFIIATLIYQIGTILL